ncbi:MAG: glycoside hydrolase family 1 protein [Deltaproteobacteria bacterium]|nr:glycoside hydrolase family 1 protein [Deltaproteobacteria bacterium]
MDVALRRILPLLAVVAGCGDKTEATDAGDDVEAGLEADAELDAGDGEDAAVEDARAEDAPFWPDGGVDVRFPDGFLWGTASAAYQVEGREDPDGGTVASNWSEWEDQDHIVGHVRSGAGAGFWDLYEEDLDRAAALGNNAVRLGVEWARIEPAEGVWDDEALGHYVAVVQAARARGMVVFLTLYHWVVPTWVQSPVARIDLVSEASDAFADAFEAFVRHVVPAFAADVDFWIPLNEPFSVVSAGYLSGDHPPGGLLDMEGAMQAGMNFIFAHARAAAAIRELDLADADGDGDPASIGNAAVANEFPPKNAADPDDVFASERIGYIVNDVFPEAWTSGNLDVNMDGDFEDVDTSPPEGFYAELAGTLDWIGINYYGPGAAEGGSFARIEPLRGLPLLAVDRYDAALPHNEMGREINAPSFLLTLRRYASWGLPLYITENGIADAADEQRGFYLLEHLRVLGMAIGEGIDVRGYLHWSLTDNFEWAYGFTQRFGLYAVDFADAGLARTERGSAALFRQVIAAGGIDDGMWSAWALERYPSDGR